MEGQSLGNRWLHQVTFQEEEEEEKEGAGGSARRASWQPPKKKTPPHSDEKLSPKYKPPKPCLVGCRQ